MALVLLDRVQQTGTANTTVSFTLSGSVPGFQSFSSIGNGNTTYYSATDASGNWEVGIGTYATGGTLTRTTILSSSNTGSAVTFTGTVNVFVTYPSNKSVNLDASGNASSLGTPAAFVGTNITGTASGLSIGGNAATATSAGNLTGGTISGNYTVSNATSPNTYYKLFGDNSGWTYRYVTNVGGTPTTRHSWTDTGNYTAVGSVTASSFSGAGTGLTGTASSLTAGAANAVAWGNVSSKPANIMFYEGFALNADTMSSNSTGFTYSVNAPLTGPIARFSAGGGYDLEINAGYSNTGIVYRARNGDTNTWQAWNSFITSANIASQSVSYAASAGSAPANGGTSAACSGNAATATNLSTTNANWSTNGVITAVVGQLAWKNYGNGHTIFDASAGTSPSGTAVNNTNSQVAWSGTYPTLMGWNGFNTYGVRVDSARVADSATTATTANQLNTANSYTAVSFTASSDERLKTNWVGLDLDFVAKLANVKSGTFERISDGRRDVGVGAQSIQKLIPEAVIESEDGMLSVNYGAAAMVACVEMAKEVKALRAEIEELKRK